MQYHDPRFQSVTHFETVRLAQKDRLSKRGWRAMPTSALILIAPFAALAWLGRRAYRIVRPREAPSQE